MAGHLIFGKPRINLMPRCISMLNLIHQPIQGGTVCVAIRTALGGLYATHSSVLNPQQHQMQQDKVMLLTTTQYTWERLTVLHFFKILTQIHTAVNILHQNVRTSETLPAGM
jgi:hypothetical protein